MVALPQDVLSPTVAAIDAHYEATQWIGWPWRLSPSTLAKTCERATWYQFRWAREPESHEGRMVRLFETGHREEDRLVRDLKSAGVNVEDRNPETGKQWEYTALDGHFRLKIDGRATGFFEAPKAEHVIELKTHNDKSFKQLKKVGVAVAKPEHVDQCQLGMHLAGIERAYYLAKNKNDDELYAERIHYDAAQAGALMAKAERILEAARPLTKISDDPDNFACRFCPSKPVCHGGEFALRNCRTCIHSTPVSGGNAKWWCEYHGRELSIDDQRAGCGNHLFIPDLVPGEQLDVSEDGATVTYRLIDGAEWIDGRAA